MQTYYPAQIVFTEAATGGRWLGRLLRPSACVDRESGKPVTGARFDITEAGARFIAVIQGAHKSGRRYATYATLTEAQRAGIRWARRRFMVAS